MSEKRITKGLLALHAALGDERGPKHVSSALNQVGGVYSQSSISLWLNGWRVPSGNARTHIRMAYGVPEALWASPANESDPPSDRGAA